MDAPFKAPQLDGRRRRSERTRQLIVEAYLDLLREHPQIPTAVQIADRAGISVRSVFERFADRLALRIAATDHAFLFGNAQARLRNLDGDRPTRLRTQVERAPKPASDGCRFGVLSTPTRPSRLI